MMFESQNYGQGNTGMPNNSQVGKGRGDRDKKIFIGGVPRSVADVEYKEYFRSFGELDDCILMRDSAGVSRGFGFVTYREKESYEMVLQATLQLRGKVLEAKKAVPENEVSAKKSDVKVFIGGLAPEVDKTKLNDYFGQYGQIADSIVMTDGQSGNSRGFGFVTYTDSAAVEELMKNPKFEFYGKQIECKRAQPAATLNRLNRSRTNGRQYGQRGGARYGAPSYGARGAYEVGQSGGGRGYVQEQFTEYRDNQWLNTQSHNQRPNQDAFPQTWVERPESNRGGYSSNGARFRPY